MKYYTKKPNRIKNIFNFNKSHKLNTSNNTGGQTHRRINNKKFPVWIFVIIAIVVIFNSVLKLFEERILSSVLNLGEVQMERKAIEVINEEVLDIYSEDFVYEDIIKIEKDSEGNITMIRADTVSQNKLTSSVVLNCNEKLSELGELGIEIPLGYLTDNLLFYQLGPKIEVKMQQIGNVKTSYESVFESAGINQTRHKIYLNVEANMRVVVPFISKDIEVVTQIPVADTIIVGQIPDTAINLNK